MNAVISNEICLVGNAQSLLSAEHGDFIDQHETVIRLNKGFPKNKISQGKKTSLVGTSCRMPYMKYRWYFGNCPLMWMVPKRTKMPNWMMRAPGTTYYSEELWQALSAKLGGRRPSTGAMMIDYLTTVVQPKTLHITGFDFKASKSVQNKTQRLGTHDWDAEKTYIVNLIEHHAQQGKDWKII